MLLVLVRQALYWLGCLLSSTLASLNTSVLLEELNACLVQKSLAYSLRLQ